MGRGPRAHVPKRRRKAVGNWRHGVLAFLSADSLGRSGLSLTSWGWLTTSIDRKTMDGYDSDCETGSSMTIPDH